MTDVNTDPIPPDDWEDTLHIPSPGNVWMRHFRSMMIRQTAKVRALIPDDHPFWAVDAWAFGCDDMPDGSLLVMTAEQERTLQELNERLRDAGSAIQFNHWGPGMVAAFYPPGNLTTEEMMALVGAAAIVQVICATHSAVNRAAVLGGQRAVAEYKLLLQQQQQMQANLMAMAEAGRKMRAVDEGRDAETC